MPNNCNRRSTAVARIVTIRPVVVIHWNGLLNFGSVRNRVSVSLFRKAIKASVSASRKTRIFSSVVYLLPFMVWFLSIEPD